MTSSISSQTITRTLIALGLIILIGLGWFFGDKILSDSETGKTSLVPENAIMVYEGNSPYDLFNGFGRVEFGKGFKEIPYLNQIIEDLSLIDSLFNPENTWEQEYSSSSLRLSFHVISKNEIDFIFYLPFETSKQRKIFKELLKSLEKSNAISISNRAYQKIGIQDVSPATANGKTLSISEIDNRLVGSFTPFLVEDVIRHHFEETGPSFYEKNIEEKGLVQIENDLGNLYFNPDRLPEFLRAVFLQQNSFMFDQTSYFSQPLFLDISATDDDLSLSGTTFGSDSYKYFIDLFKDEKPSSPKLIRFAPMNTAMLYEYSFSNGISFLEKHRKYLKESGQDSIINQWYDLGTNKEIFLEHLFRDVGDRFGLAILESHIVDQDPQLFFLRCSDPESMQDQLNRFSEKLGKDSIIVVNEKYGAYLLQEFNIKEFPSKLLGGFFNGFEKSYFTFFDDYLVIANHLHVLKGFLKDQENENTWGKSIKMNSYFEQAAHEANITSIMSTPRAIEVLSPRLHPYWAKIFKENEEAIKNFDLIAAQWQYLDGRYYTDINIHYRDKPKEGIKRKTKVSYALSLSGGLSSPPYVVRNHEDRTFETISQLADNSISLVSRNGQQLWNNSQVKERLISKPIQLDYFKNKKLQYLIATSKRLHLIDRLGRAVEGFPIRYAKSEDQEISSISLLDYDNSKDYRFLYSDKRGKIYLSDKTGKILDGWKGVELGSPLSTPAKHLRVKGKDVIIMLTQKGILHAKKRNGSSYKGFPIDLDGRYSNPIFIEEGSNFDNSIVYMISDDGLFHKINLSGKIKENTQLLKESPYANFQLAINPEKTEFRISRFENQQLSIIDNKFDLLFRRELAALQTPQIQFYEFEGGMDIIGVQLESFSQMKFYDKNGSEYDWSPISTNFPMAILFYEDQEEIRFYRNFRDQSSLLKLELR